MFITRLISGIMLLIIAIIVFALGNIFLLPVLWLISMIAYRELTKALGCPVNGKGFNTLEIIGFVGVTAYYAAIWAGRNGTYGSDALYLLMVITAVFLAELFAYVITFPRFKAQQVVAAFFSFMYAPVMLAFIYLTRETANGIYMVWLILISSWGCDTCAYAVGKLIGRRKIFPVLSPNKSLEGCIGGVLGSAIIGGLYGRFFVEAVYPERSITFIVALICALGAVMSMVGDLAASAIKRNNNI
ncbi:MAG: phosphatidate cytidylyltransferase, partial [Lachnospiraceae bacterium]|nr:phosphatidate cytidylyltransferase [Lachnospiraceae bacterium]